MILVLQVFTIHALLGENLMVPTVYCLLTNKQQSTYERVFDEIRQQLSERNMAFPTMAFTTDFEDGLMNALRIHFPGNYLKFKVEELGKTNE